MKHFEEYTHNLTTSEIVFAMPIIIDILSKTDNRKNAVTNQYIASVVNSRQSEVRIKPSRVRAIIHHIRVTGKVKLVVATKNGYHVCDNRSECEDYLDSLESRIVSIAQVRTAIWNQMNEEITIAKAS